MNMMQALKCDFCGGQLVMDDSREFATCEMCGTKYMKTTIQQKIQEIRGSVTVQGDVSVKQADFIIRGGVLEKYNGSSTEAIIPNSVTHIGESAFENCKGLTSVSIPNTVVEIGNKAFYGCESLTGVELPSSLTSVGIEAFANCKKLETVSYPKSLPLHTFFIAFINTPWFAQAQKELMAQKRCRHCGGEFRGVFGIGKTCLKCGKLKDYGIIR